jgi:hypothetical protein
MIMKISGKKRSGVTVLPVDRRPVTSRSERMGRERRAALQSGHQGNNSLHTYS